MNNLVTKEKAPLAVLNDQLDRRAAEFKAALPPHIPVERFKRVLLTAVQMNNDLLTADRPTLWTSAMKCAQDGLLPDGREAALVIYNTKIKHNGKDVSIRAVQYMPMVAGIRKKVRNSGEITTWEAHVVHAKDAFDFALGDEAFITHKPFLGDGEPGPVIAAYSIARLKTGEISREVMTRSQIEKVRAVSRAKDLPSGPWTKFYEEMCRKTVARRHSKVLPMSTDLDDLIRRDDALYDLDGAGDATAAPPRPKLSDFTPSVVGDREPDDGDAHSGEIIEGESTANEDDPPPPGPEVDNSAENAAALGTADAEAGKPCRPPEDMSEDEVKAYRRAYQEGEKAKSAKAKKP